MKAIRVYEFGGPEVLKLEDTGDLQPGPGEVLVRIHAAGVNPVDTYIRAGVYPHKPRLPYTPGFDAAGMIEKVGEGVEQLKAGDRVYTHGAVTGTYAEAAICAESQVHLLPEKLSFSQGAAIGIPYATAYRALFQKAHAAPAETVLVHGATGAVGIAAVQIARSAGLTVLATGGTERGRKLTSEQGAHFVFDHKAEGYEQKIKDAASSRGVDVVLEMLADVNLEKDLDLLAPRGRVIVIGCRGSVEVNPRRMMGLDTSVIGMTLFNASEAELDSIHAALAAGFENKSLRPVVGEEIPLKDAAAAHEKIVQGPAYGKMILKI